MDGCDSYQWHSGGTSFPSSSKDFSERYSCRQSMQTSHNNIYEGPQSSDHWTCSSVHSGHQTCSVLKMFLLVFRSESVVSSVYCCCYETHNNTALSYKNELEQSETLMHWRIQTHSSLQPTHILYIIYMHSMTHPPAKYSNIHTVNSCSSFSTDEDSPAQRRLSQLL